MKKLMITKEFGWDCAHFLHDNSISDDENVAIFGPCNKIHGHTYSLFISISAKELTNGMVMNFVLLNTIVKELVVDRFDHTLLNDDTLYKYRLTTCENQVQDIWDILEPTLSSVDVELEKIILYETPTSFAELTK